MIVVTTETAVGYHVERTLEMVWGEGRSRTAAVAAMEQTARELHADGVVCVRWETSERDPEEARQYFVYGTAVILRPVEASE